jgi:DnaJ-domain-containing protein 1
MESTAQSIACPGCGRPPCSTLACLACGRVLNEPEGADLFARLGLQQRIDLDADLLEANYLRLSRALHPDFHGGADTELRELANRNSSLLNEAQRVLTDDQARAEYLLECIDPAALERWKTLAPDFLMQAMELSEEVEQARGPDAAQLSGLVARLRAEIAPRAAALADAASWTTPDTRRLATLLHELRVLRRILRDAERGS